MQTPYSAQFEDIYFSAEDGLAETRHTFLNGNGLPERWAERQRFTIAETGFGTGLNFLAAWDLFDRTAPKGSVLDYIAIELYPLEAEAISVALERWRGELGTKLDALLAQYPIRVPGFHRLHFPRVRLTLIFDDVGTALSQVTAPQGVDAWFLDGFAPAKNPQMWSEPLYMEMNRLSAPGATAATFTAAGMVRRGLAKTGFTVEKKPGYGRKRDMTVARLPGPEKSPPARPSSIAIIGGGLAGTACAFTLKRRGFDPVLYEASDALAAGASGNALGLCNPRFSAHRTAESDFYAASYAFAFRQFGMEACGSLHLMNTPEKEKRFRSLAEHWQWPAEHVRLLNAGEASDMAGIALTVPALWLPQSMQVSPAALCRAYAQDIRIETGRAVNAPKHKDGGWIVDGKTYETVILANGPGIRNILPFPVHTVRGQATTIRGTTDSLRLKTSLCFGGYISAPYDGGLHMVGSSFQKWLDHTDVLAEDDADNLARLGSNVPSLAGRYEIAESRAALRLASRDHNPIAGLCEPSLYISAAHGSHGILSSLSCAEVIADSIDHSPFSLSAESRARLSPQRFNEKPAASEN